LNEYKALCSDGVKPEGHLSAATVAQTTPFTDVPKSTPCVQHPGFRTLCLGLSSLLCLLHTGVKLCRKSSTLNSSASGCFRGFSEEKRLNTRGFAQEIVRTSMLYKPGKSLKRRGKSSSLRLKKKFLLGGCGFFVSDVISRGLLGHLGPLCLALGANR